MSDGDKALRSLLMAIEGSNDSDSMRSPFFGPVVETKELPEHERYVEVRITVPGSQTGNPKLLLPQAIFDGFSESEKNALPKMFEQFITNRTFRSTMSYDLSSLPGPSTSQQPRSKLHGDRRSTLRPLHAISLAKIQPITALDFGRIRNQRTSYLFPLLDLPAELRILVANYVLRVPDGLQWFWRNYRKGPRVATLNGRSISFRHKYMEDFTSLSRTCKQIYEETRGLVLQVNVISFNLYQMHSYQVPKACEDESGGSNCDLRAASEALGFIQRFAACDQHRSLKHIDITVQSFDMIRHHWNQFKNLMDRLKDTSVTVTIQDWIIIPLSNHAQKRLKLLEDEGEPFVPEQEQMRERADDYFGKRQEVQEFVANLDQRPRNWRIHPRPTLLGSAGKLRGCLPSDVLDVIEALENHGI